MKCPKCGNRMAGELVMGGAAWRCPTEGCGWFHLEMIDTKRRRGAA